MSAYHRLITTLVMIAALLPSTSLPAAAKDSAPGKNSAVSFTRIDFVSNIETIGVAVSGGGLPATAQLSYRKSGEMVWRTGHELMLIDDGRLIGSLFNLSPATMYEIRVSDGSSEISGSATTQPEQLPFTPLVTLHVNDDALAGGNGSAVAPYRTIQEAVNHAAPGTQVLVADGTYREAVTFPVSGTPGKWIQVKAAGTGAILDGADRLSGNIWTAHSTNRVWYTRVNGPVAYLARAGKRFYQYDDKTGLMQKIGHGGVTINEGWFYEPGTSRLYVRSLDNPSGHAWQLPRLNHAFDVNARDWLWIEGFEIRFYGTTTNGCGVCTLNASQLIIRKNKIHNMQLGIFINWNGTLSQGNDTRIEQNDVYDPGLYGQPWASLKGSLMEGTGIIVRGHTGAIVRENTIYGFFNGIYTGSSGALENSELAFDADIYDNTIFNISDDAMEPEGACINHRFRNNTVDRSFIAVSIAPVTKGPTWVLHSVFSNYTGRGIKFADQSDGMVLVYHNTGWTNVSNINGADLITPVHTVKMRNNIFESSGYSIYEVPTGSTRNDWNNDNWYTTRGTAGPHFKWENVNYNTISSLCAATGLECSGYEDLPGFTDPAGGDFSLLPSSPNIDRGVVIAGINDGFLGDAPDVGAYESTYTLSPTVLSILRTEPNPVNVPVVSFAVTFSKPVSGVDTADFVLMTSGLAGASILNVSGSGQSYMVAVDKGSGFGALHLEVPVSATVNDLSGAPLESLPFKGGQSYLILDAPTFADTTVDHWAWEFIERLYAEGVTAGCLTSPMKYCPGSTVTRAEMAVFLLRAVHGSGYHPPSASGVFEDVDPDYWAAGWIEQLAAEGITVGCSVTPKRYCPTAGVTRAEMAVFLLRARFGSGYMPPEATGIFQDVPSDYWAADWIEQLAALEITTGCNASPRQYCPGAAVTRAEMAVFLVRTFSLP
ncbi:MAG TPA: S-layer homology domain-containing protein [Anaerolineales bacterium]|nr:S-layer homology domain-containing protein [Anaerolineales bacterium]